MSYFIYLIILICLEYFLISLCNFNKNYKENVFLLFSFLQCILFIGCRADISVDTYTYLMYYDLIGQEKLGIIHKIVNLEIGYVFFNKIIYILCGNNRFIFLSSCAILSCFPIFLFIKKNNTNILLSVIIWCVFNGMNTAVGNIRQSIAIGIVLLSYHAIVQRKFIISFLLILIASTFHLSAIFLLIVFPLYFISKKIELSFRNLTLFLPIFVIIFIFSDQLFKFLLENTVDSYYSYLTDLRNNAFGSYMYTFVTLLIFSFSLFIYKKFSDKDLKLNFYLYMLLLGILFYAISIKNGINRIALYFVSSYIFIIPKVFNLISKDKRIKIILLVLIFICFAAVISGMYFLPSSFIIGKYRPFYIT